MMTSPLLDLSALPFRPAAVLAIEPSENDTASHLVAPLLRAALARRYGHEEYPESAFYRHLSAIFERQELGSCAFAGIALVYPDHDSDVPIDRAGIEEPIVVAGVCQAGIHWRLPRKIYSPEKPNESFDGTLVYVIFLILSGEDQDKDLRLKAAISRWVSTRAGK